MDTFIMIAQFVTSLSLLIILHELGHFIPARWFKTRVEKFYLFFDPYFSLFKKKIGDTEYGIGWLPLGGYVKISGMVDESMDMEQLKQEPQPWEFRSKPAWQRLIIMLGGVTVNFILGFVILSGILMYWGDTYIPADALTQGIKVDSIGGTLGLKDGDKIKSISGVPFTEFELKPLVTNLVLKDNPNIVVDRAGQLITLTPSPEAISFLSSHKMKDLDIIAPRIENIVGAVVAGRPAEKGGLLAGDKILSLNGMPAAYYQDFVALIKGLPSQEIELKVLRAADTIALKVTTDENAKIGFSIPSLEKMFKVEYRKYSFFEAIPAGINKGLDFLGLQISSFGQMFKGKIKASDSLGGFASITKMFPTEWIWQEFWRITAILSLILGFMNLLPIPALDGGHVMFLLWEVITGRKVSDKFLEVATTIGFVLLLALLIYANGLDIFRAFK